MFKVVPDQLRISEGWVRCGQCDEVFDANAHLLKDLPGLPAIEPSSNVSDPSGSKEEFENLVTQSEMPETDVSPAPVERSADTYPEEALDPFLAKSPQELSAFAGVDLEPDLQNPAPKHFVIPPYDDAVDGTGSLDSPRYRQAEMPLPEAVNMPGISFMKPMPPVKSVRRPVYAVLAGATALLMALALGVQVALQERDRIASLDPGAESILRAACSLFTCKVLPLRQIESVVIDSSAFTKVRADIYRLNCTLKNTASTTVAMPALELTLTDAQDQAVIRRVFSSGDLGSQSGMLMPGAELLASLPLSLKLPANSGKIAGYRLLAFYP
jgi:predicted Zn finger-like uncharacterized protein